MADAIVAACIAARSIEKWFNWPTPHDDRNQFKRVVQDEDIGDGAGDDPASICVPKIVGGDARRASRRLLDREADDDEIAESLDHGQARAGERAVRQPHAVVAFSHLLAAEPIVAIRHAGGGGRVSDRVEVWDRSQCDTDRARMHMEEVRNDLGIARMRQRGAHNSRSAVDQGRHRVEEVGHPVVTALEAPTGGLVVTPLSARMVAWSFTTSDAASQAVGSSMRITRASSASAFMISTSFCLTVDRLPTVASRSRSTPCRANRHAPYVLDSTPTARL